VLEKECEERELKWIPRVEVSPRYGNMWKNQTDIHWCHDPKINENSLNAFYVAMNEYKSALPGCIDFRKVDWTDGKCEGFPQIPAIHLTSSTMGCFVTNIGETKLGIRMKAGVRSSVLNLHPDCQLGESDDREERKRKRRRQNK